MNNYFLQKIKSLPAEVEAYLTSTKGDNLNVLIVEKYRLNLAQIRSYADLLASLFLKETPVSSLVEEIKHIFGFSENVARQMACDIIGVRLLVVVDWLGGDLVGLIKSWGGDPNKYISHVEAQKKAIVSEAKWLEEQLAEPVVEEIMDEEIDWADREQKIKEIFANDLVSVLGLNDRHLIGEINNDIFYLLSNIRETIKDELASIMLNNNEMLTSEKIVLDGKQAEPTIANWLAYFLSQKGSTMFDSLALSDFITNSANAKSLDIGEKKLLTDMLAVYGNLKFFPISMGSNNPDDWHIFPLPPVEEEDENITPQSQNQESSYYDQPIQAPAETRFESPTEIPEQPKVLSQETEAQIKELQEMAERYEANSLERLALEEEIVKLRK